MTDEQFAEALNKIINEHMSDTSFNADFVTRKLNITHTMLLKKMDNLLGTNFDTYVMRIKMSIVQDKLENTDDDLEKIAEDTGYSNVEMMNSSFKRVTGKTIWSIRENA
jgi:YesN/AraC family two-component response regulator